MLTLRFRARAGLLVPQIGALDASPKRFVGRRFDASLADASKGISGGWPALPDGEEIQVHEHHVSEFRRECLEGALWPGDQATADVLRVKFDPTFGEDVEAPKPVRLVKDSKSVGA